MKEIIEKNIKEHEEMIKGLRELSPQIEKFSEILKDLFNKNGHLFVCGNGGSAADSQHLVGELRGHFEKERKPLRATALSVDTSTITAIGNDYGYEFVFSRQLEALANKNDVLLAISTSGNSKNIIEAVKKAKELGVLSVALTGGSGGELAKLADHSIVVDSNRTSRIQEGHELIIHTICEIIDSDERN